MKITKSQLKQIIKEEISKALTEQGLGDVRARAASAQSGLDAFRSRRRPSPTSQPTTTGQTQRPTTTAGQTQRPATTGQTQRPTRTQSTSATVRTADMTPDQQAAFRTMAADTSSITGTRIPSLARSARAGRLRRAIAGGWDPTTGEEGLYRYHQEQGTRYSGPYQPPE